MFNFSLGLCKEKNETNFWKNKTIFLNSMTCDFSVKFFSGGSKLVDMLNIICCDWYSCYVKKYREITRNRYKTCILFLMQKCYSRLQNSGFFFFFSKMAVNFSKIGSNWKFSNWLPLWIKTEDEKKFLILASISSSTFLRILAHSTVLKKILE